MCNQQPSGTPIQQPNITVNPTIHPPNITLNPNFHMPHVTHGLKPDITFKAQPFRNSKVYIKRYSTCIKRT